MRSPTVSWTDMEQASVEDIGPIGRKSPAPTGRLTLKYYRDKGYEVHNAEQYNAFSQRKNDLFGFVDYVAVGHGELLMIQATSVSNMAARRKKIRLSPVFPMLLDVPGVRVLLIGWRKVNNRWVAKEEEM